MKSELISARFPKEDALIIEETAKEEKTDKTTALKKIFALGARQLKMEKALKQYQAGRISTGKAAETAGMVTETVKQTAETATETTEGVTKALSDTAKELKEKIKLPFGGE